MISEKARSEIRKNVQVKGYDEGVYCFSLHLYAKNIEEYRKAYPKATQKSAEDLCLLQTSLDSLTDTAFKTFNNACDEVYKKRIRARRVDSFFRDVFVNLISSALFIVISLIFIVAFKETVKSFVLSLGLATIP